MRVSSANIPGIQCWSVHSCYLIKTKYKNILENFGKILCVTWHKTWIFYKKNSHIVEWFPIGPIQNGSSCFALHAPEFLNWTLHNHVCKQHCHHIRQSIRPDYLGNVRAHSVRWLLLAAAANRPSDSVECRDNVEPIEPWKNWKYYCDCKCEYFCTEK